MPKYKTEVFGQFIYSPEISYDELLKLEEDIKSFITDTMESFGAEFLAFESEGDRTFFQGILQERGGELAEKIAAAFTRKLNEHTECKLMFVDKMLCEHHFYALNHKGAKLEKMTMPAAGPLDKALLAEGE